MGWSVQIADAMAYLEKKRIVHCDLAAKNILVKKPDCVVIGSFSAARFLSSDKKSFHLEEVKLPRAWLAPECLSQHLFSHKSDIWAFGVTLWETFTYGAEPVTNTDDQDQTMEYLPQPEVCTADLYKIIANCWNTEPNERPTFQWLSDKFSNMNKNPEEFLFRSDSPGRIEIFSARYSSATSSEMVKLT